MEARNSCWILALVRLLGEVCAIWSWTPGRAPYSLASNYLNAAQRPLWILEDELMKRQQADREEENYMRRQGRQRRRKQAITIRLRGDSSSETEATEAPQVQRPRKYPKPKAQRRRQPQSLPIFDSAPGDNAVAGSSAPIFVYNGSRGELLLNTMLSARRYPMQEPVPGQVLYPPSTPMFRPKPIVERFRVPGAKELLNLTLIPFYAHEAMTTTTTTDLPALAATETEAMTTPLMPYRGKRQRKAKKVKQYNAYRSPQEVMQWQPTLRTSPPLEAPDNHRHYLVETTTERSTEESPQEQEEFEETTGSSTSSSTSPSSSFQIVYVDESMEPPSDSLDSTTEAPQLEQEQEKRHSSRYALKREYFAFPVYTLGKLLQHPRRQHTQRERARDLDIECLECSKEQHDDDADDDDNTWFILNSRYKGPHGKDQTKYYTSKYIQSASKLDRS